MKREVIWAPDAREDYFDTIRYIARDNPDAALRAGARIETTAANLGDFATGRAGRVVGTYEKPVRGLPYILAYELTEVAAGREVVAILHVIHTARDWPEGEWPA